jgi:hypothetical protein
MIARHGGSSRIGGHGRPSTGRRGGMVRLTCHHPITSCSRGTLGRHKFQIFAIRVGVSDTGRVASGVGSRAPTRDGGEPPARGSAGRLHPAGGAFRGWRWPRRRGSKRGKAPSPERLRDATAEPGAPHARPLERRVGFDVSPGVVRSSHALGAPAWAGYPSAQGSVSRAGVHSPGVQSRGRTPASRSVGGRRAGRPARPARLPAT